MGLKPLEFEDCILDSPYFRENIHEHERELERTNEAIKGLIKECKTLLKAIESRCPFSCAFIALIHSGIAFVHAWKSLTYFQRTAPKFKATALRTRVSKLTSVVFLSLRRTDFLQRTFV